MLDCSFTICPQEDDQAASAVGVAHADSATQPRTSGTLLATLAVQSQAVLTGQDGAAAPGGLQSGPELAQAQPVAPQQQTTGREAVAEQVGGGVQFCGLHTHAVKACCPHTIPPRGRRCSLTTTDMVATQPHARDGMHFRTLLCVPLWLSMPVHQPGSIVSQLV